MFLHHSDQMYQRSQVSRVALWMSSSKVLTQSRSPIELFWTAKNGEQSQYSLSAGCWIFYSQWAELDVRFYSNHVLSICEDCLIFGSKARQEDGKHVTKLWFSRHMSTIAGPCIAPMPNLHLSPFSSIFPLTQLPPPVPLPSSPTFSQRKCWWKDFAHRPPLPGSTSTSSTCCHKNQVTNYYEIDNSTFKRVEGGVL